MLPTVAPDLNYDNLDTVQSGDMVEPVYFEMVDAATTVERKRELETALLTYCARALREGKNAPAVSDGGVA